MLNPFDIFNKNSEHIPSTGPRFNDTITIANTTAVLGSPIVTSVGNHVYLSWTDLDLRNGSRLYLSTSNDSGTSFNKPIVVSEKTASTNLPFLAASGNNVYVAWLSQAGKA